MSNSGKYDEELLRRYFDHEDIEKAPEGFTGKIMSEISAQPLIRGNANSFIIKNRVPVISGAVTILLVLSAFLFKDDEKDLFSILLSQNMPESAIPGVIEKMYDLLNLSLPGWFPYLLISLLILFFFDRALFTLTHISKNP